MSSIFHSIFQLCDLNCSVTVVWLSACVSFFFEKINSLMATTGPHVVEGHGGSGEEVSEAHATPRVILFIFLSLEYCVKPTQCFFFFLHERHAPCCELSGSYCHRREAGLIQLLMQRMLCRCLFLLSGHPPVISWEVYAHSMFSCHKPTWELHPWP